MKLHDILTTDAVPTPLPTESDTEIPFEHAPLEAPPLPEEEIIALKQLAQIFIESIDWDSMYDTD